jgi:polar amino acid transport system substrate-binding protein
MESRSLIVILLVLTICLFSAGCTQPPDGRGPSINPAATIIPENASRAVAGQGTSSGKLTTEDLIAFVSKARDYARQNGREKALAAFNDPKGEFVQDGLYIFAEAYDGTALAEPLQADLIGTNILDFKDSFGVPLVKNLGETAHYGMGYVSYEYPNPARNYTTEPKLSVVADVDGTYYVGAGMYESSGMVYPSVVLNPASKVNTKEDLVAFTRSAIEYARKNGKEKALDTFNDPKGPFVQGELVIIAFDYNGTNLVGPPYARELSRYHINLINYHDPDGIGTIRGMRDLARGGGGILYTVTKVPAGGREIYIPKIDYAEPVDDTWWLFSGITAPDYAQLRTGNTTGIRIRNHSREDLYALVNRAVGYAHTYGKEKALAEINNPDGQFTDGDLSVWAETFDGTILADPYWKAGIGNNYLNYTDPYGARTTMVAIDAIRNGTGFSNDMFPDTTTGSMRSIPKLVYMKAVDDTWWIGGGIYGVRIG